VPARPAPVRGRRFKLATNIRMYEGATEMAAELGITRSGESLNNIVWDILGQTYKPVQLSAASFAFDTLFPPGTFVPPHFHPDQDEFIRVLEGDFDLWLDGEDQKASAGDLIRLPMGSKHGIFNKSNANTRALFWVAPSKRLYDLFVKIDKVADPTEVVRIAAEYNIFFLPPPG
jgi:quercetin dioxygenase-like cupin family protein